MPDEDADLFDRAHSAWSPTAGGDGSDAYWCVSVLNEPLDLDRAMACRCAPSARDDDGSRRKLDHARACALSVAPKSAEIEILSAVASRVDPAPDERGLSFAYASGECSSTSETFVVEHTWTPEALRGRGLGKKAVRGCVEFVVARKIFGELPGRTREDRYKVALARHVDATCSYAKRALEELRREAGL
jgi:predicted GNAT family acetyltransferase